MQPTITSITRSTSRVAIVAVLCCAAALGWAQAAAAATFTVTKLTDTADGTCDTDCSLREAITAANASATNDVVVLGAGTHVLTIAGTDENNNANGDLDVAASAGAGELRIQGAGMDASIIDAAALNNERAIHTLTSIFTMEDLTVQNGSPEGHADAQGGGLRLQGATTTINDSRVTGNSSASTGGGIQLITTTLTMNDSRVDANTSEGNGAGIHVDVNSTSIANRSELSENHAEGAITDGGAITVQGMGNSAALYDSTVYGNTADADGGGVYADVNGTLTFVNTTFMNNIADDDDNGTGVGGGYFAQSGGVTITTTNSLFVDNYNSTPATPENCYDANENSLNWTGTGANLMDDSTNCDDALLWDGTLTINATPMLGAFGLNGGTTRTVPLLAGSPAINAGTNALCARPTDQRGVARTVGTTCDIGAFEVDSSTDLKVEFAPANPATTVGTPTDVTFTVTNIGNDPAFGVTFSAPVPAGVTVASAGTGLGCSGSPTVSCTLTGAGLNPGVGVTAKLTLTPSAAGSTSITGTAAHAGTDPVAANNQATAALVATAAVVPPTTTPPTVTPPAVTPPATTPPTDVCPNIAGAQAAVPAGMITDSSGSCVTPTDACPNIAGVQATVPTGMMMLAGRCVGGPGITVFTGTAGNDIVDGRAGNDTLNGRGGNDNLSGGAGADKVNGDAGNDTLRGGAGNDTLKGGAGNDKVFGDAGNDTMFGGAGQDTMSGGAGNDKVNGDAGNDKLNGDAGNDTVNGGTGNDTLNGGAGNDRLVGGPGVDTFACGAGTDVAIINRGERTIGCETVIVRS